MLEELIIQINGVLEAGDHYDNTQCRLQPSWLTSKSVNLALAYLYICRSLYIRSQLTSITSPISFFSPLINALFDDGPNQGKSIKLRKI